MTIEQETLTGLIRAALGTGHGRSIPAGVNWQEVIDLSYRQGVSAIAADGLQAIADNDPQHCPDIEGTQLEIPMLSWIGDTFSRENRYMEYRDNIASLISFYSSHGIRTMILKGLGLSYLYPIPEHRATGDIDVYLFGKQKEADRLVAEELGIEVKDLSEHHTQFHFREEFVENHYDIVNTKVARSAKWIEAKLKDLASGGGNRLDINGATAFTPSDPLNAIFLIRHLGQHFSGSEASVRQLLDWALFVESTQGRVYNSSLRDNAAGIQGEKVDWEEVRSFLREMGMLEFFHDINDICSHCFGTCMLGDSVVTALTPLQQRMLDDIFSPEFNEDEKGHRGNILSLFVFRTRRYFTNGWKRRMVYRENLVGAFTTNAVNRVRRLILGKEKI